MSLCVNIIVHGLSSVSQVPTAHEMLEEQVQDDPVLRKLFIRGLGTETNKETIAEFFQAYGEVHTSLYILICTNTLTNTHTTGGRCDNCE